MRLDAADRALRFVIKNAYLAGMRLISESSKLKLEALELRSRNRFDSNATRDSRFLADP
jgi:hypothetical protein